MTPHHYRPHHHHQPHHHHYSSQPLSNYHPVSPPIFMYHPINYLVQPAALPSPACGSAQSHGHPRLPTQRRACLRAAARPLPKAADAPERLCAPSPPPAAFSCGSPSPPALPPPPSGPAPPLTPPTCAALHSRAGHPAQPAALRRATGHSPPLTRPCPAAQATQPGLRLCAEPPATQATPPHSPSLA